MSKSILNDGHWTMNNFKQRMTTKNWKRLLLDGDDKIIYRGYLTQLKARKLGYGVVELSKDLKKENSDDQKE